MYVCIKSSKQTIIAYLWEATYSFRATAKYYTISSMAWSLKIFKSFT